MEINFQKIQLAISHYILIAHWSHETFAFFYTQMRTTTACQTPYNIEHFLIECGDIVQRLDNVFFF